MNAHTIWHIAWRRSYRVSALFNAIGKRRTLSSSVAWLINWHSCQCKVYHAELSIYLRTFFIFWNHCSNISISYTCQDSIALFSLLGDQMIMSLLFVFTVVPLCIHCRSESVHTVTLDAWFRTYDMCDRLKMPLHTSWIYSPYGLEGWNQGCCCATCAVWVINDMLNVYDIIQRSFRLSSTFFALPNVMLSSSFQKSLRTWTTVWCGRWLG